MLHNNWSRALTLNSRDVCTYVNIKITDLYHSILIYLSKSPSDEGEHNRRRNAQKECPEGMLRSPEVIPRMNAQKPRSNA